MQKHHRGERRFQTERLKKNRRNYWGYGRTYTDGPTRMTVRQLGVVSRTPALCNCIFCGHHARKLYGNGQGAKTIQELSDLQYLKHCC